MIKKYIIISTIYLVLCASLVLFLSSTWRQFGILHAGILLLALYFAGGFIHASRIALSEIFNITHHYEVITRQGATILAQTINMSNDEKSIQIIYKEVVSYIYTSDILFVDDVTNDGRVRKTFTKFLFDSMKGDK
jgi:hypothetical protein